MQKQYETCPQNPSFWILLFGILFNDLSSSFIQWTLYYVCGFLCNWMEREPPWELLSLVWDSTGIVREPGSEMYLPVSGKDTVCRSEIRDRCFHPRSHCSCFLYGRQWKFKFCSQQVKSLLMTFKAIVETIVPTGTLSYWWWGNEKKNSGGLWGTLVWNLLWWCKDQGNSVLDCLLITRYWAKSWNSRE